MTLKGKQKGFFGLTNQISTKLRHLTVVCIISGPHILRWSGHQGTSHVW